MALINATSVAAALDPSVEFDIICREHSLLVSRHCNQVVILAGYLDPWLASFTSLKQIRLELKCTCSGSALMDHISL